MLSTNIIERLRYIGIEPECTCKETEPGRPDRDPKYAIEYGNQENYFHSGENQDNQWW